LGEFIKITGFGPDGIFKGNPEVATLGVINFKGDFWVLFKGVDISEGGVAIVVGNPTFFRGGILPEKGAANGGRMIGGELKISDSNRGD